MNNKIFFLISYQFTCREIAYRVTLFDLEGCETLVWLVGKEFFTKENMSSVLNKLKLVKVNESKRFMIDCFKAVNVPQDHAEQQADLLVAADYRGHFSHGMNRLEMYLNDLSIKSTNGSAVPTILKETPSTAWIDGNNGLGAVIGNFCMDVAIKKAKQTGVGWVCAKGSNHYGMASWYPLRAIKKGLIGFSMTNTSPIMVPTRGKDAVLGTNPLSMGVPAKHDKFLLDMATTAVALGKVEIQQRKGEPLPTGWALDHRGKETLDANLAFESGRLMPLGGTEVNSGYKGYGKIITNRISIIIYNFKSYFTITRI